jgi:hypothetical protein
MRRTADTRGTLDISGDGADAQERTHADREGVDAVGDAGAFEVERYRIAEAGELRHGVQSTRENQFWKRIRSSYNIYPVVSEGQGN